MSGTISRRTETRTTVEYEPAGLAPIRTEHQGKPNRTAACWSVVVTRGTWTTEGNPDDTAATLDVQFRLDYFGRQSTWTWHDQDPPGTRRVLREGTDLVLLGFLEEHAPEVFA